MSWLSCIVGFCSNSIRRRLVLGIALVHAVLMTVFVYDMVQRQHEFHGEQSIAQAMSLAETLAAGSVSWVLADDIVGLEEVLGSLKKQDGLRYAMLLSPELRVLSHTLSSQQGLYTSDSISRRLLTAEGNTLLHNGYELIDVAAPVRANGEIVGWARIGLDQTRAHNALAVISRDGVIYTLIAILIGTIIAILMSRGITADLQRLVNAADAFRRGERSQRVALKRRDEVGNLASVFDLMLGTIEAEERMKEAARQELEHNRDRLEEEVNRRTEALQEANRELESFSYSVSHDLRAPLRGINGFSQLLVNNYSEQIDDTGRDYLQRILRASNHMGDLIDELLALARVSRCELQRRPVAMGKLAERGIERLREAYPEREVEVMIGEMPEVNADPTLMGVVLDNLLGNAWKFTAGREDARIEMGCRHKREQCIYYVRDNGAGFDMRYVDKLFGIFQRLHNAEDFEGTGVGLATVQRILHRHGGRIWAEAEEGKGATFYFIVPDEA